MQQSKEQKQEAAKILIQQRATRTPEEQIKKLDDEGHVAAKERLRLNRFLNKRVK